MLEILYDEATRRVLAWNADSKVVGNLNPQAGQKVVILPINPPTVVSDFYTVDLAKQTVLPNPAYVPPPDYKKLWEKAGTATEKIGVLAKAVGLE